MNIAQLLEAHASRLKLQPPAESFCCSPHLALQLPPDLQEFYQITNGALVLVGDLSKQSSISWKINGVQSLMIADHCFYGGKVSFEFEKLHGVCHPMFETCVLLAGNGNTHLTIDLDQLRYGKCYAATLEMHLMREDIVVAASFSEWLERLLTTPGDRPYWEQPGFPHLSAYDQ